LETPNSPTFFIGKPNYLWKPQIFPWKPQFFPRKSQIPHGNTTFSHIFIGKPKLFVEAPNFQKILLETTNFKKNSIGNCKFQEQMIGNPKLSQIYY